MMKRLVLAVAFLISSSFSAICIQAQTVADVPKLIKELRAGSPPRAIPAAEQLARLGPEAKEATEALAGALGSSDVQLRVAAAKALTAIGPGAESATSALIKLLSDRSRFLTEDDRDSQQDEYEVWQYAADALAAIGPSAVKPMLEVLDPKDPVVYHAVCTALHRMGPAAADAIPRLIELVEKNDDDVIAPIFALQGIGPSAKAAVPALIVVLDHKNFHAQYFACRALGAIGADAEPAVEKLAERLKNGVTSVRRNAATALGQIGTAGGDAVVPALISALDDPLHPVRVEAIVGLGRMGPAAAAAVPKIKQMLEDERFVGKAPAAGALWRIDPNEQEYAFQVLLKEVQGDNAPWEAAQELGELAPKANRVNEIAQLLDDSREGTREFAAEALGMMGESAKSALDKLESIANDEQQSEDVRAAARDAIVKIAKSR